MKWIQRATAGAALAMLAGASFAGVSCQPVAAGEVFVSPITNPGKISPTDGTCWVNNLKISMADGVKLTANVFLPKITSPDQKFPTIIMTNSWVCPDWEYIGQAQRLARDGYIVLEYASRGWWGSEGQIRVAAPEDIQDVSTLFDWMAANVPMDTANVATSGISYGAGISLLAAERDPRIKTVAAFSGWANLEDELYPQDTPNKSNVNLLVGVAPLGGRLSDEVTNLSNELLNPDTSQQRAEDIKAWARVRSPLQEVGKFNQRNTPVFLSKNYSDEMFTPNSSLQLFMAVQGPKKLVLNRGWHATAEALGALAGVNNYPYDQAHRWFDYWLKGKDNGIMSEPQVDMAVENTFTRETLPTWPAAAVRSQTLYVAPRGDVRFDLGCFCLKGSTGALQTSRDTSSYTDSISSHTDTVATTGVPVVSDVLAGVLGLDPMAFVPFVNRANGVVYNGAALSSTFKLRGMVKLQLNLKPSGSQAQVLAYLYDVDALGMGTLITHGARSLHWATPGQTVSLPVDLHFASYNVPKGHHLALVLDTQDPHYGAASNSDFTDQFMFSYSQVSTLTVPYIN
ncbi:CocE/NonD family hydrolase [Aquabacterium sp.]|uniref:CocE/NonD family hydrolase n=1 Tax=Aquabacterium sp. TaxID=1872578 RepID=UPI0035AE4EAB